MDWNGINFDWNRARAFLATAESGSLSAAARSMAMTQPTLGRQVSALEEELEVVLFERVGRGLRLTPAGFELLEHVRKMGEAASAVALSAAGKSTAVEGSVSISASEVDAALRLPPILKKIRDRHPGIDIVIVATNAESDLRLREADIAIRNYRPTQETLIARRVAEIRGGLYASPAYLDSIGNPQSPEEFRDAAFIGFNRSGELIEALKMFGLALTQANFPVVSESHLVQWAYVKAGLGIGILSRDLGDSDPAVRPVLPDLDPMGIPVWLVSHRELQTSRRVRLVFDLLAEELSGTGTGG